MAGFSLVRSGRKGEALIDGALRVENAADIKMKLLDMIEREDRVVITIGENAEADLSFFQIICSAHRVAVKMNKSFGITPVRPAAFIRSSADAGFPMEKGCACDIQGNCVWMLKDEI
jgi:hypothetical protein